LSTPLISLAAPASLVIPFPSISLIPLFLPLFSLSSPSSPSPTGKHADWDCGLQQAHVQGRHLRQVKKAASRVRETVKMIPLPNRTEPHSLSTSPSTLLSLSLSLSG